MAIQENAIEDAIGVNNRDLFFPLRDQPHELRQDPTSRAPSYLTGLPHLCCNGQIWSASGAAGKSSEA
jgi:hypothetical protein